MRSQSLNSYISEELETIAEFCGEYVVWELIKKVGGTQIFIPSCKDYYGNYAFSKLSEETRTSLIQHFGGLRAHIPLMGDAKATTKSAAARWLREQGLKICEIAVTLGISENSVLNYLNSSNLNS